MGIKSLIKGLLIVGMSFFVLGAGNFASGKPFSMALAPATEWRAVADVKDTKDFANTVYGYAKLDKIYDVDSYYMYASAVKDYSRDLNEMWNAYADVVTVKQGGGSVSMLEQRYSNSMQLGSTYYLRLKNLNWTDNYRNASGSFGWN